MNTFVLQPTKMSLAVKIENTGVLENRFFFSLKIAITLTRFRLHVYLLKGLVFISGNNWLRLPELMMRTTGIRL